MRGAFFVNVEASTPKQDRLIDFFVLDPNYQVIYSKRKHEEGIFRFNTTMKGQYTFVFSNMKDRVNKKKVTLAIHPGFTESEELTKVEQKEIEKENKEMAKAANVPE